MRDARYIATALCTLLLTAPAFAGAVTIDELQKQISMLLGQIAQLKAQLGLTEVQNSGNFSNAGGCPSLTHTLALGSSGSEVANLQGYLANEGYFQGTLDGDFDRTTESAVQLWQKEHSVVSGGSPETTGWGVVGARTRAAIFSACGGYAGGASSGGGSGQIVLNPGVPISRSYPGGPCPVAAPPKTACPVDWTANTDSKGCVTSYRCAVPISYVPSATSTGSTTSSTANFSASASSGTSPLTVTFTVKAGVYNLSTLYVDFGDGSYGPLGVQTTQHIYTRGTYTSGLRSTSNSFGPISTIPITVY